MLNISLNQVIDLSTAATFGFLSISGLMSGSKCSDKPRVSGCSEPNSCNKNCGIDDEGKNMTCVDMSKCPVSSCSRANFKMAVAVGSVTSALYLYRAVKN